MKKRFIFLTIVCSISAHTVEAQSQPICGRLSNMLTAINSRPEKGCLYEHARQDVVVVSQVSADGVLVHSWETPSETSLKNAFIFKGKKLDDLVDGAPLPDGLYEYVGTYTYQTVFGAARTVYSFKPH